MIIKTILIFGVVMIGFINYYLAKSFWFHEGIWGKDVHDQ